MVGVTNVGKSTLINAIIQEITGDKDVITTSRFPGTTLDKIEIPLDDGSYIYDTPGIIHRHQMAHYLTAKTSSTSALARKSSQRPTSSIQNKPCSWLVWDDLTLWLVNAKALRPSLIMSSNSTAPSCRS